MTINVHGACTTSVGLWLQYMYVSIVLLETVVVAMPLVAQNSLTGSHAHAHVQCTMFVCHTKFSKAKICLVHVATKILLCR